MRLLTLLVLLLPQLLILLENPQATAGEVDTAGGSCRKPGEGGSLPGSHMTDDCSVRIDDVGDRASEAASDGKRRGAEEWQRKRDEGRNEDPKIKVRGRNAKEGKGRQDKSEKEREGSGEKRDLGQLKKRDDEKSKLTDKHKKKEKKEKKYRDEITSHDEEKKFHKRDKKNRNDNHGKKDKRKKDKGGKNYEDKQWHKSDDDEGRRKNKRKDRKRKENHSKEDHDKKRKDQRAIEEERHDDMTSGNRKKKGKNTKYDENVGKDKKKPEDNQPQKTVEPTKENRKEEKTSAVAEEHGTCEAAAGGGTRSEKATRDGLLGSDECGTNDKEDDDVPLGDKDEGGISVNDDDVKGKEGELDGLGEHMKHSTRVSFGNGMFVDLEVDSSELLLQEGVGSTKGEVASEARVPETPDQEGITDGKDNNQKTGREGEDGKAEEDIDPDGRGGKTHEKGEGEGDQVESDGQARQRDNGGGLDPVVSRMLEEEPEAPQRQETNSYAPVIEMANPGEEADKSE